MRFLARCVPGADPALAEKYAYAVSSSGVCPSAKTETVSVQVGAERTAAERD
jgi:hypothetical protein